MSAEKDFIEIAVQAQLGPWINRKISFSELENYIVSESSNSYSYFGFVIDGASVSLVEKPNWQYDANGNYNIKVFSDRADTYVRMLTRVAEYKPFERRILIGIDLDDLAPERVAYPVFSFQKNRGELNILLPDFEFEWNDYSAPAPARGLSFSEKHTLAVFAGSTTGLRLITMDAAREAVTQRLSAHRYFQNVNDVDFRLPNIVQCESTEVEDYLRSQGLGESNLNWDDTFSAKFVLSLDGNGATCSRQYFVTSSTSVMIKYNSPFCLYWSEFMIPWLHYIPVSNHEDVSQVLSNENKNPGTYQYISLASQQFADENLCKNSVLRYAHTLIKKYSDLF